MQIFYSAKQNAFINDDFHGVRMLEVDDPDWVRPTVKTDDPSWTRPDIEVSNPAWHEGDDSVPETIFVPDMNAVAPQIDMPDFNVEHPRITVPNPQCLLPPEAELVEVPREEYDAILRAVANRKSVFTADKNGRPILIDAPGPTLEERKNSQRSLRDKALLLTDPLVARHRDELESERPTTLTAAQYKQLQGYRQDLRDWPETEHFPDIAYRPEQPTWLAEQLQ